MRKRVIVAAIAAAVSLVATGCSSPVRLVGERVDHHLLGEQPGHQPRQRQAGPDARAQRVHQADRGQGQARGDRLERPADAASRPPSRRARARTSLNIGNTWAASLQATGAFLPFGDTEMKAIGGSDKFVQDRARDRWRARQDRHERPALRSRLRPVLQQDRCSPTPGISRPPTGRTWSPTRRSSPRAPVRLLARGGQLHGERALRVHQLGAERRRVVRQRAATRRSPRQANIDGIKRYLDLMQADKVVEHLERAVRQRCPGGERLRHRQGRDDPQPEQRRRVDRRQRHEADQYGVVPSRADRWQGRSPASSPESTCRSSRTPRTRTPPSSSSST